MNLSTRLLRQHEVSYATGLPKSTIYWLIARDEFPKPVKLSKRAVGWPLEAIEAWLASRKVAA